MLVKKTYEFKNYLGHVVLTTTDRKFGIDETQDSEINYYVSDITSQTDYFPYGIAMPERKASIGDYCYAAFGFEQDQEVSGEGNSHTTFFRSYDPRLGRWKSPDPVIHPWESDYVGFADNPILYTDPSGDDVSAVVEAVGEVLEQVGDAVVEAVDEIGEAIQDVAGGGEGGGDKTYVDSDGIFTVEATRPQATSEVPMVSGHDIITPIPFLTCTTGTCADFQDYGGDNDENKSIIDYILQFDKDLGDQMNKDYVDPLFETKRRPSKNRNPTPIEELLSKTDQSEVDQMINVFGDSRFNIGSGGQNTVTVSSDQSYSSVDGDSPQLQQQTGENVNEAVEVKAKDKVQIFKHGKNNFGGDYYKPSGELYKTETYKTRYWMEMHLDGHLLLEVEFDTLMIRTEVK